MATDPKILAELDQLRPANGRRIKDLEARGVPLPGLPGLYIQTLLEHLLDIEGELEAAQLRYERRLPAVLGEQERRADQAEAEFKSAKVRSQLGIT